MTCQRPAIALPLLLLFIHIHAIAQHTVRLPRSTPEAEGVASSRIVQFFDAAAKSKTEFHSFMLLRHGKVIAEGWWNPYGPDLKHTLYSCSKSFTATAIGFAVQEKLLSLTDHVISFFPNDLPDAMSANLSALTVKDVLMMSDGQEPDPTSTIPGKDSNWIKGFLATPVVHQPGTTFLYNSMGTYMLSAIIQKVTGQKTIDYLKPRLFQPLGIVGMDWETDAKGINTGGWGLRLKTEDMAKFAELFLRRGNWNGKQLIPASWIDEASTVKIMQDTSAPQSKKDSSDWLQGYCYQMWRCRNNAYRGDGAFGQFMIVMPDQDAVLAVTAETADMQEEINLVWKYLLPAFEKNTLPANKVAVTNLLKKEKDLLLQTPPTCNEAIAMALNGRHFTVRPNDMHLREISFRVLKDVCEVNFQTDTATYPIRFGAGRWQSGETNMPGPSLVAGAIENRSMIFPAKISASYTCKDAQTLNLSLRYIESPHTETYECRVEGDQLTVTVARSLDFGKSNTVLQAKRNSHSLN